MKAFLRCLLLLTAVLIVPELSWAGEGWRINQVDKPEEAKWLRAVIPLPHEIAIDRKIILNARQVQVELSPAAGFLERRAAAEMTNLIVRKFGAKSKPDSTGGFRIILGCCSKDGKLAGRVVPGADRLFSLPNSAQAYRIVPLEESGLLLVGSRPEGVYYAAKTLGQLLKFIPAANGGQIVIPLLQATDWPDMAERGLWGGDANDDMEWMSRWKMNFVLTHVNLAIGPDGRGVATIPQELLADARMHDMKLTPIIKHFDQWPASIFLRYPQLKAIGAPPDKKTWRKLGATSVQPAFRSP